MRIDDFVVASRRVETVDELFALFHRAMEDLGFDRVLVTLLNRHDALSEDAQYGLFYSYPAAWAERYLEAGYGDIDPVRTLMTQQQLPFTWRQILLESTLSEDQLTLFRESAEGGLHHGIGIPLRGPGGAIAGLGAASSSRDQVPDPDALERAHLLANQFYVCFWRLKQKVPGLHLDLTAKEAEVLQWCASGLTRKEVSDRMGVSVHTVDFHCRNALRRLSVPNVTAAVVRAMNLGLI